MITATVIFDLDQTLYDQRGSADSAARVWLARRGITWNDQVAAIWADAETQRYDEMASGSITHQEQTRARFRYLLPKLGLPVPLADAALDDETEEFASLYRSHMQAFGDALPCVRRLNACDVPLAIITNGNLSHQQHKASAIGISELIPRLFASSAIGFSKPDPRTFEVVCAELGVDPADCWYVGDNYAVDMVGAHAAGLRAVYLDRRRSPHGAHRPHGPSNTESPAIAGVSTIHTLDDLEGVLNGPDASR